MNRQGSNNLWSLWGALLVVPILALALYLHLTQSSHIPSEFPRALNTNNSFEGDGAIPPMPSAGNASLAANSPALNSPSPATDEIKPPVALDHEVARTAVHQVENGVYERATAMFEQEAVDVEWATAYEQSLRVMFAQHQGLQRVSINSISCHTSMCRIEVFTPRDADADFFTAMFYDGLANFRAGELNAEAAITRRMEQGMTSVYVARKDHTLGFY